MENQKYMSKVLLYEIGFFLKADIIAKVYFKIAKCLNEEFFINLYI